MKKYKLTCVSCSYEAIFKYMDELYCPECLIDKLLEDELIKKAEYDPGIYGDYKEDN